ncbi:MAG: DUF3090 family protein [Candidatus Dormibacteria bacterium]
MGEEIEFDPAETVAVGTVGKPGARAFFIQATQGHRRLTMLVEKIQVQALAERTAELLEDEKVGAREKAASLVEPIEADWRAGQMGLGWDADRRLVVMVAQEAPEDEEVDPDTLSSARLWIRPEQMLALAARGLELCTAGRPLCPVCGLPMDPEGHHCPRKNGKSPVF